MFPGTFAQQKRFPPSKSKLLSRDVGLHSTTQFVSSPTYAMPRRSSHMWLLNQHIPNTFAKRGTKHHARLNGGSSNPFASASLSTSWSEAVLFGFSPPGGWGSQLAPWLQGSVGSASIPDQHSECLSSSAWLWKISLRKDRQLRKKISHISRLL